MYESCLLLFPLWILQLPGQVISNLIALIASEYDITFKQARQTKSTTTLHREKGWKVKSDYMDLTQLNFDCLERPRRATAENSFLISQCCRMLVFWFTSSDTTGTIKVLHLWFTRKVASMQNRAKSSFCLPNSSTKKYYFCLSLFGVNSSNSLHIFPNDFHKPHNNNNNTLHYLLWLFDITGHLQDCHAMAHLFYIQGHP